MTPQEELNKLNDATFEQMSSQVKLLLDQGKDPNDITFVISELFKGVSSDNLRIAYAFSLVKYAQAQQ